MILAIAFLLIISVGSYFTISNFTKIKKISVGKCPTCNHESLIYSMYYRGYAFLCENCMDSFEIDSDKFERRSIKWVDSRKTNYKMDAIRKPWGGSCKYVMWFRNTKSSECNICNAVTDFKKCISC